MITLNNIKSNQGSRKKSKRLGRGNGSGKGTYCGRGMNGQNCRSGGGVPQWFEGGQTPLFRRMPKLKGFSNAMFKTEYSVINLSDIEKLAEKGITEINKQVLLENRVVRKKTLGIKLLGNGELKSKVEITVDKASETASKAILKAGGKIEII
ncbi:50S ribosomal protein L15 [Candidatus Gracilibacteria bacterium]|nr:MAG: 50S ribosomal protein L15 [Candidatus Gracilibacteria bacterium]PIE85747.1 MAG: 50S ribosomal protein L15 [Candidatus Gracilibacteria bacterium]